MKHPVDPRTESAEIFSFRSLLLAAARPCLEHWAGWVRVQPLPNLLVPSSGALRAPASTTGEKEDRRDPGQSGAASSLPDPPPTAPAKGQEPLGPPNSQELDESSLPSHRGQLSSLESASLARGDQRPECPGMSHSSDQTRARNPPLLGAPSSRPGVHWAALRGPPSLGLSVEMWPKEIWFLGAEPLRPSSKLPPSPGSFCVRREGVSFCSPRDTPEETTRSRAPAEPEMRWLPQGNRFLHTTCRPGGPARRTRRSPHPNGPWGPAPAACGPTALRFLSATRPAAAPSLAARPAAGHWSAVPILHRLLWANRRVAPT